MFDVLAGICVMAPVFAGWKEGAPISLVMAFVGALYGPGLGILSAVLFRLPLSWIQERWGRSIDELPEAWRVATLICLEIGAFAWVFGLVMVTFIMTRMAIRHVAA